MNQVKKLRSLMRQVAVNRVANGFFHYRNKRWKNAKTLLDGVMLQRFHDESILIPAEQVRLTQNLMAEAFRIGFEAGLRNRSF